MGKMEEQSRKRTRRVHLKRIILQTVAVAGMLSVAAVAPNVLGAMARLNLLPVKRQKEFIIASRARLLKQGLLTYADGFLRLTPKGEQTLGMLTLRDHRLKKPKRWDGKWRVLIFDVPEERRTLRDKIRRTLVAIGFVRLQDSVWLYPYDCEDVLVLLKADLKIGKQLLYLIVDAMEYDIPYRKAFGLPLP